jgi:phage tail sheath protein FI
MPSEPPSQVTVEESPGSQAIVAASTSVAVFVGVTETGRVNQPTPIANWGEYVGAFGGFMWGCQTPFAVYAFFVEGGRQCYVTRAATQPPNAALAAAHAAEVLTFSAASPGAWGDGLRVAIVDFPPAGGASAETPSFAIEVFYRVPPAGVAMSPLDQLAAAYAAENGLAPVSLGAGELAYRVESFSGFTAADLEKPAAQLSNLEARINAASLFIRVATTPGGARRPANIAPPAPLAGGAGEPGAPPLDLASALSSLDLLDDISLLAVPDTTAIGDYGRQREVVRQVIGYCEARPRRDLFCIADSPFGLGVDDIVAFKTGAASADGTVPAGAALSSSYAALYDPWIVFMNTATSMNAPMPPSGAMAGCYAETDTAEGVWIAAAGVQQGALSLAVDVTSPLTDAQQEVLLPAGVNAIRRIPRYGIVAWGARTLSDDPDFRHVPVRRLLTWIELSMRTGLQWVAFEPNDPQLWARATAEVTQFLTQIWQAGGLFGATAAEAFIVQCDVSNNPPESVLNGQLNVAVTLAPIKPAEFMLIQLQLATASPG